MQDFQEATGEVVESFSESSDDGTGKGPQSSSTTSHTAGKSEGGPNSQGFSDMVRCCRGQNARTIFPDSKCAVPKTLA